MKRKARGMRFGANVRVIQLKIKKVKLKRGKAWGMGTLIRNGDTPALPVRILGFSQINQDNNFVDKVNCVVVCSTRGLESVL